MSASSGNFEKLGQRFEHFVAAYLPAPIVAVLLLTFLALGLALWTASTPPPDLLKYWNSGFRELLPLTARITLLLVTIEALFLGETGRKLLNRLASIPKSNQSAVLGLALVSVAAGWVHWVLAIFLMPLVARAIAQKLHDRKQAVHYPSLGAAACMGLLLSKAGLGAPQPELAGLPANIAACATLVILVPLVLGSLPSRRQFLGIERFSLEPQDYKLRRITEEKPKTLAEKLERSYLTNAVVASLGGIYVIRQVANGVAVDTDLPLFLFFLVGLALHSHPLSYAEAVTGSMRKAGAMILLVPLYGGVLGILRDSGLTTEACRFLVSLASTETLPLFAMGAALLHKIFVPFGPEWFSSGSVFLDAAPGLGAAPATTALGLAYGDMVGNLVQPFWALPALAMMGLRPRNVASAFLAVFLFAFPTLGIALLIS